MGDYINREEAVEAIMDSLRNDPFVVDADTSQDFVDGSEEQGKEDAALLLQIPAADVRENRRGRWVQTMRAHVEGTVSYAPRWGCSCCGREFLQDPSNLHFLFCPECGADLRGEDQNG